MLSSEIGNIFKSFPQINKLFLGCFSADTLPQLLRVNHFCIANTDHSTGLGKHWYIIFRPSNTTIEVFDSLGIDEHKKTFLESNLKIKNVQKIVFNLTQFQLEISETCGNFAVYFIVNRLHNLDHSFKSLLEEIFDENKDKNEELVKKFFQDILTDD